MLSKLWKSSRPRNARRRAFDFRFLARFRKDTCGGVLIYTAFMIPVILGISGLAVDASLWYGHKRDLQATADVAALTAALEMTRIDDETLAKTAAKADAITNGFDESEGDTLEINTPPTSGPFAGQSGVFEAIVTRPVLGGSWVQGLDKYTPGLAPESDPGSARGLGKIWVWGRRSE